MRIRRAVLLCLGERLVRKETNLGDRVADDHLEPLEGSEYDAAPRSPTDFGPA